MNSRVVITVFAFLAFVISGCVQRSITITTEPTGALVWLNDKEVGRTPVTVPFEWYGDYDVVVRKNGFQPLATNRRIHTPWYQYPPIDFVAELLYPATIHDDHTWQFTLETSKPISPDDLLTRASEMQRDAVGDQDEDSNEPSD